MTTVYKPEFYRTSYWKYYEVQDISKAGEKHLSHIARVYFDGSPTDAKDEIDDLANTVPVPVFESLIASPTFHFLRSLVLGSLGLQEKAGEAIEQCATRGGDPQRCTSDLAVFLAENDRMVLAQQMLEEQVREQPDNLAAQTNLFAVAIANDDATATALAIAALAARKGVITRVILESRGKGLPSHNFLAVYLSAALRWLRRVDWEGGEIPEPGRSMVYLGFELIVVLDLLPAFQRDYCLMKILQFTLVDSDVMQKWMHWGAGKFGAASASMALLKAGLDFNRCEAGSEDALAVLAAEDGDGFFALLGLALAYTDRSELDREYECLERLMKRHPDYYRFPFHAASNRFRAGDQRLANELARAAISTYGEEGLAGYYDVAHYNAEIMDQGIAAGLKERTKEVDVYASADWVEDYWNIYHFEFRRFTHRENHSVFLNRLYVNSVEDLQGEHPDLRRVVNLGSFCGYFDHMLAESHPELSVVGFDRDEAVIELNRRHFTAPNLDFQSADLDSVLKEAVAAGATVVTHVRTCTLMFPAGVAAFYEQCREAGVKYIVGIESTGYSWQIDGFPDPDDFDRPPVVPLGIMVDHNYPRLLRDAGYRLFKRDLFMYPVIHEERVAQEQFVPVRYVAELA